MAASRAWAGLSERPERSGLAARAAALAVAASWLVACATLPAGPRPPSTALAGPDGTALARRLAPPPGERPGRSGIVVLEAPADALAARVALAEAAEHTLDAQYYTWAADRVGQLLAARLLAAADRGVRVRLLVDDIELRGRDANIAALDAHPGIEIRLFNPFAGRSAIRFSRTLQFLTSIARLDHRMHNKAFIADNAAAVVGGRNIGEGYFGVSDERDYRDLDALVSGPAAGAVSEAFDHYWNSEWAVPVDALRPPGTAEDLAWARGALHDVGLRATFPYPLPAGREDAERWLTRVAPDQAWAPAVVVADDPRKAGDEDVRRVRAKIVALAATAERDLLLQTPYLVLRTAGVDTLHRLTRRGAAVQILTNSLAATDVVAVHGGYSAKRNDLLDAGVGLYELRPDAARAPALPAAPGVPTTLHAKSGVVDGATVFLGSANLDQRSSDLNTEMILVVESPAIAARVARFIRDGMHPANAWRLRRDGGDTVWLERRGEAVAEHRREPKTGAGRRAAAALFRVLPIKGEL